MEQQQQQQQQQVREMHPTVREDPVNSIDDEESDYDTDDEEDMEQKMFGFAAMEKNNVCSNDNDEDDEDDDDDEDAMEPTMTLEDVLRGYNDDDNDDNDGDDDIIEEDNDDDDDGDEGKKTVQNPAPQIDETLFLDPRRRGALGRDSIILEHIGYVKSIIDDNRLLVETTPTITDDDDERNMSNNGNRKGKRKREIDIEKVVSLGEQTVLLLSDQSPLGIIGEVFGPVHNPFYIVYFRDRAHMASTLKLSQEELSPDRFSSHERIKVFYDRNVPAIGAPTEATGSLTQLINVSEIIKIKGSDASWKEDTEPPESHLEYSDDEEERVARRLLKARRQKSQRRPKKEGWLQQLRASEGMLEIPSITGVNPEQSLFPAQKRARRGHQNPFASYSEMYADIDSPPDWSTDPTALVSYAAEEPEFDPVTKNIVMPQCAKVETMVVQNVPQQKQHQEKEQEQRQQLQADNKTSTCAIL